MSWGRAREEILKLLASYGPMTGKDLVAESNGSIETPWVYVLLEDMERCGQIEVHECLKVRVYGMLFNRFVYRISRNGYRVLHGPPFNLRPSKA